MAADENYAIKIKFEGIEDSISQIQKIQQAVSSLKFPVSKITIEADIKAVSKAQADIAAQSSFKASETLLGIETLRMISMSFCCSCFKASETLLGIETDQTAINQTTRKASKPLKPF